MKKWTVNTLSTYYGGVTTTLRSSDTVSNDSELQAFVQLLRQRVPSVPASVTMGVEELALFVTQTMFLNGVEHHSVNSDAMSNYLLVYPAAGGKLGTYKAS